MRWRGFRVLIRRPAMCSAELLYSYELHDAAGDVPVLYIQVAVLVPGGAVRAAKDTLDPLVLGHIKIHSLFWIGVVAKHGNDRVALVEDDQSPVQIRHGDIIPLHRR